MKRILIIAGVIVFVFVLMPLLYVSLTLRSGSGSKEEGAALQVAELLFRERVISQPTIEEIRGRHYLLLKGSEGNTVIMLDPNFPPYYKQLPHRSSYEIDEVVFLKILHSEYRDKTILNVLESRIRKEGDTSYKSPAPLSGEKTKRDEAPQPNQCFQQMLDR